MASITLQIAQRQLQAWIDADLAVSTGQMYQIGTRRLQGSDAAEITNKINYWRNEVEKLQAGRSGCRVMRAIPRDL